MVESSICAQGAEMMPERHGTNSASLYHLREIVHIMPSPSRFLIGSRRRRMTRPFPTLNQHYTHVDADDERRFAEKKQAQNGGIDASNSPINHDDTDPSP